VLVLDHQTVHRALIDWLAVHNILYIRQRQGLHGPSPSWACMYAQQFFNAHSFAPATQIQQH
jgi:hypothetical protein